MPKATTPNISDFIGQPPSSDTPTTIEPLTISESKIATKTKPVKSAEIVAKSEKIATSAKAEADSIPQETSATAEPKETLEVKETNSMRQVPIEPLRPRPTSRLSRPLSSSSRPVLNTHSRPSLVLNAPNSLERLERMSEKDVPTVILKGVLDTSRDGHGVLRSSFSGGERDAYISTSQIRRFRLRAGDVIEGPGREPKENERYWGLLKVDVVNGMKAEELMEMDRIKFHSLTPVYPDSQIKLEIGEEPLSLRIVDLVAPIGKGQRSLVVSPPKAGKTTLLKDIATGIAQNHPEIHVMAVLVGERPEEVTDIRRHIDRITKGLGEVAASNFDEPAEDQCHVAELALEKAKRMVEMGKDVVILLDSITRLARAYNLSIPTSGRTLSGGFDPAALFPPKKFFGAARNFEVNGSLTIIGTALVETGSRMDDLIYEEFKGTGNQEVTLDRRLAERRIYPAIDVQRSGTRRDDLLIDPMTYQSLMTLQRMLDTLDKEERTMTLVGQLKRSKTNKEFLASLKAA